MKKYLYILIFTFAPFFLLVVESNYVQYLTFLMLGLLLIISHYWQPIKSFYATFEIVFLFLLINFVLIELGLQKILPLKNVFLLSCLYFFLLRIRKTDKQKLFIIKGNLQGSFLIGLLFTVVSIVSLALWFLNQTGNPYAAMIPNLPLYLLIPAGLVFAIINAVYEEGLFRSIFLSIFSDEIGFTSALFLQAVWFSFLHYQVGFPSGVIGILLTFVFGLMTGYLVKRTKGLLLPVVIHFFADVAVFSLVVLRITEIV